MLDELYASEDVAQWLIILFFSTWGGVVRFLMKNKFTSKNKIKNAILSQIVVSCFTGTISGMYCIYSEYNTSIVIIVSAISGTLGGSLLKLVWAAYYKYLKLAFERK